MVWYIPLTIPFLYYLVIVPLSQLIYGPHYSVKNGAVLLFCILGLKLKVISESLSTLPATFDV